MASLPYMIMNDMIYCFLFSSLISRNVAQTLHGELLLLWFLSTFYVRTKPYLASFVHFTSCGKEPKIASAQPQINH